MAVEMDEKIKPTPIRFELDYMQRWRVCQNLIGSGFAPQ